MQGIRLPKAKAKWGVMIEVLRESYDNILGVKVSGKLTDLDYKTILVSQLGGMIRDYQKVRCLFLMPMGFQGW